MDTDASAVSAPAIEQSADFGGTQAPAGDQATAEAVSPPAESFSSLNPEELAPELQAVYKQMQADYTRKTQEVAKARSAASEDPRAALLSDPAMLSMLENLSKYGTVTPPEAPAEPEYVPEWTKKSGDQLLLDILDNPNSLRDIIREEAERIADEKANGAIRPFAQAQAQREVDSQDAALRSAHPEFNDQGFRDQVADLIESGLVSDPEAGYRYLMFDRISESAKADKARSEAATAAPSAASVRPSSKGPLTFAEAYQLAKAAQGL